MKLNRESKSVDVQLLNLTTLWPMTSCLVAASRSTERALLRIPSTSASFIRPQNGHLSLGLRSGVGYSTSNWPRRSISTSLIRQDYHFDTHHFVQRLEKEGLTRAQAEGIMSSMAEVIDESIRTMTRNMVTKSEQEKVGNSCPL